VDPSTFEWLCHALQLDAAASERLAGRLRDDGTAGEAAELAITLLARRIQPGRLPVIVRRPLPASGDRSLLDLLLDDPVGQVDLIERTFDWSGIA